MSKRLKIFERIIMGKHICKISTCFFKSYTFFNVLKRIRYLIIFFFLLTSLLFSEDVYVRGYFRKDGTYVSPYYRSAPDGNFWNNWSTKGNINPYTGKEGTKVTPPSNYNWRSFEFDKTYSQNYSWIENQSTQSLLKGKKGKNRSYFKKDSSSFNYIGKDDFADVDASIYALIKSGDKVFLPSKGIIYDSRGSRRINSVEEIDSLIGINIIRVVVEDLDFVAEKSDCMEEKIKNDVEKKLESKGFVVLPIKKGIGLPFLYINVCNYENEENCYSTISVSLYQHVYLATNFNKTFAQTWESRISRIIEKNGFEITLRDEIKKQIDIFSADCLKANSKKKF